MFSTQDAIIDFGSSKIVAMTGTRTRDGGFVVTATAESKYSGFMDGQWNDFASITVIVKSLIQQLQFSIRKKINKVFVGVPGDFCSAAIGKSSLEFKGVHKISHKDEEKLFELANKFDDVDSYEIIARSPICYSIDGNIVMDPIGVQAKQINATMSFVFAVKSFVTDITTVFKNIGIKKLEFISSNMAQALFLIDTMQRDEYAILIDCGYITTNVMLIKGDGLLSLKSFAVGSAQISLDLCDILKISFPQAEALHSKINLNLEFDAHDTYVIDSKCAPNSRMANDIVIARIEDIASLVIKCLASYEGSFPSNTKIFLTGGGLTYLKGATETLGSSLDKPVRIASIPFMAVNQNEYSSAYSLLNIALNNK